MNDIWKTSAEQGSRSDARFLDYQDSATTLGETAGGTVTMTLNWGIWRVRCIFSPARILALAQIVATRDLPVSLLGHDHCVHDVWHDNGRFCRRSLGSDIGGSTTFARY